MILQGQAGIQSVNDGNIATARMGRQGDMIVSELHGRYYETAVRGNMFGITGGLTTTTAAGAAIFTGITVNNPAGSGYNLVMNKIFIAQPVALTAETELGIMYGANVVTGALVPANRMAGGRASVANASAGLTFTAAMTSFVVISSGGTAVQPVNHSADLEGSVIIPPGYSVASYTSRVTTTALVFCLNWEEVPIIA